MVNEHVRPTMTAAINPFALPESKLWEVTFRYKLATIAVTLPAQNRPLAVNAAINMLSSIVPQILIPQGAEIKKTEVSE